MDRHEADQHGGDRYVALLRGISPSGPNMTNDRLRGVFERLGLAEVASVLSSGNIVFRSDDAKPATLEQQVEAALAHDLGLSSRTILRSYAELRRLLDSDPFPGLTHGRGTYLTATFLKDATTARGREHPLGDALTRDVRYDSAARVVLAVTNNSDPGRTPQFMLWLENLYGKDITTRTWLTVHRIVTKMESQGAT